MNAQDITLAREVVPLDCWEPVAGLTVLPVLADGTVEDQRGIVLWWDGGIGAAWWPDLRESRAHTTDHLLPDLTHPLTKGWLLHLARKVWGSDGYVCRVMGDPVRWVCWVRMGPQPTGFYADTEHAALCAAIKAGAGR